MVVPFMDSLFTLFPKLRGQSYFPVYLCIQLPLHEARMSKFCYITLNREFNHILSYRASTTQGELGYFQNVMKQPIS